MITPPVALPPAPRKRLSTTVSFVCLTVLMLALLGVYAWETAHHIDASGLLPFLAVIGAGIPGAAALGKIGEVGANVNTVQHLTNGNMHRLLDLIDTTIMAQMTATAQTHASLQQAVTAATTTEPAHPLVDPSPDAGPPPSAGSPQ